MKISNRKPSVRACVVLTFVGIAMVAGASWAAETKDAKEGSTTIMCKTYATEMAGSSRDDTVLKICPEGVAYRNASMGKEHMIPWRSVERWRYYGPKEKGANPGRDEYSILRIETSSAAWGGGFEHEPRYHHDLRFKICCTAGDGYEVWTEMNKYRGTRRF
jgi:hypothetical protein